MYAGQRHISGSPFFSLVGFKCVRNKCKFLVPPKVSPFHAEETLHLGDRTTLTCSVTKGDLPLTISWLKDGRNVDPAQMVSVTQVDQFTSILLIENLSPDHNGNYTCVVRNLAAEVSHSHQLVVNGTHY